MAEALSNQGNVRKKVPGTFNSLMRVLEYIFLFLYFLVLSSLDFSYNIMSYY